MLIGEPEVIDMNTNMDEDKPAEDKKPENMDEDGKKFEEPLIDHASNELPAGPGAVGGQQQALSEVVQQDVVGNARSDLAKSRKPAVVLTPIVVTSTGTAQWKADLMPTQFNSGLLSKTQVHNGGTVSQVRASKRNATTSEQDSLEKATKLKARRNLDSSSAKGKESQPMSFNILDDFDLLARTNSFGVILGNNEQEVLCSINNLRTLERHRLNEVDHLVVGNKCILDDASTVCSLEDNLELEALNFICSQISEGLGDGGCDPLCLQTPVSQTTKASSKNREKKLKIRLNERNFLELQRFCRY